MRGAPDVLQLAAAVYKPLLHPEPATYLAGLSPEKQGLAWLFYRLWYLNPDVCWVSLVPYVHCIAIKLLCHGVASFSFELLGRP